MRPTADLKPHPRNPNTHPKEQIDIFAKIVRATGWRSPIVVSARSGFVIKGHGKLLVAQALGCAEVPVDIQEYASEDEEWQDLLADNRIAELSEREDSVVASLLKELGEHGAVPELTGYDAEAVNLLLAKLAPAGELQDAEPDFDHAKELQRKWGTKFGQVWQLGDHRMMCGSATSDADLGRLMGGGHADLIVTSPPYNVDIQYDQHVDRMRTDTYLKLMADTMAAAGNVLAEGRYVAWNVGVSPKSMHFDHARLLGEAGFTFWRQVVWAKAGVAFPIWQFTEDSRLARKYHPNYVHEMIYLFSKGEPETGALCEVDDVYSKDIWEICQATSTRDIPGIVGKRSKGFKVEHGHKTAAHPAAFPLGIPAGCVKHLTAKGETVLDPFAGSGTTLIACENLGRMGRGMDISPAYVAVAIDRWNRLTGKQPKLLD
jgi:DNA modification methylase